MRAPEGSILGPLSLGAEANKLPVWRSYVGRVSAEPRAGFQVSSLLPGYQQPTAPTSAG